MTKWHYSGDINLEYSGIFFDLSEWQHGYVPAVRIDDLDRACGFTGAVLIESLSINGTDDLDRIEHALSSIGAALLPNGDIDDNGHIIPKRKRTAHRMCIAYALISYGYYDVDRSETLQLERDQPIKFGGWCAKRYTKSLRRYVQREFLS